MLKGGHIIVAHMRDQQDDKKTATQHPRRPPRQVQGAQAFGESPTPMVAKRDVRSPSDVLALQRLVGNQAVGRRLDRQVSAQIQRKDDAQDTSTIDTEQAKYTPNFAAPLSKAAPAGFKVTVAVSQKIPEYLTFAKTRMKSTIRNKVRSAVRSVPGASLAIRKPKSGQQIKEKAAVKAAGVQPGTPVTDPAVANILQNSDSVGHSWIKLSPVDAAGKVIQTYSFGFIPANPGAPHGPQQAVAGLVRNPDLEFEAYADYNNRYLDTTVSPKAYEKALFKIAQLMAGPPAYMTIGYNCTQFTKDIANAAGAAFPGKAGMMIPVSDRGFMKRAMSPNALYDKLGDNLNTEDTSDERDMLQDPNFFEGPQGITQTGAARRNRGLELTDIMAADDAATVPVAKDAVVIPTGASFGTMLQVEYEGRQLYAVKDDLIQHLKQLEPASKSKWKLKGSLIVRTSRGLVPIKSGANIMVREFEEDEILLESDRDAGGTRGTCELLPFWQAVSGVSLS